MKIPKVELTEGEDAYCIGKKGEVPHLFIDKSNGCVTMMYPVAAAVTPEAMRGIYASEREGRLELFLHFVSEGDVDRLWCVGEMDFSKEGRKDVIDWTRKVNSRYRK